MSRLGGFWIGMAIVTGVANYGLKQMVQGTANDLASVQRKTIAEQKEIHELQADWTFLNQPELLADLNKRYVGLAPVTPKQVGVAIDSIPLRPATAPPEPQPQIATPDAPREATTAQITPLDPPDPVLAAPPPIVRTVASGAAPAPVMRVAAGAPVSPSIDALFAQAAGDR